MDNLYKKLARSGWRQGKKYKKESNRDIRNYQHGESEDYSFNDAHLEIKGTDYSVIDDLHEVKSTKSKKNKLPKSVEKEISRYLSDVNYANRLANMYNTIPNDINKLIESVIGNWAYGYYMSTYQNYKKAIKELPKYLERSDLPNKLRRRIKEVIG